MRERVIKPDRRSAERRSTRLSTLADAVEEINWRERRVYCWHLESTCTEERRRRCSAHFVEQNCWDLWALEYFPPGRKPCCHPDTDCAECSVSQAKFGDSLSVYVAVPSRTSAASSREPNVAPPTCCSFLYSRKDAQAVGMDDESRQIFKCQHRSGIVLHSSYVTDVCSTPDHEECAFYEE